VRWRVEECGDVGGGLGFEAGCVGDAPKVSGGLLAAQVIVEGAQVGWERGRGCAGRGDGFAAGWDVARRAPGAARVRVDDKWHRSGGDEFMAAAGDVAHDLEAGDESEGFGEGDHAAGVPLTAGLDDATAVNCHGAVGANPAAGHGGGGTEREPHVFVAGVKDIGRDDGGRGDGFDGDGGGRGRGRGDGWRGGRGGDGRDGRWRWHWDGHWHGCGRRGWSHHWRWRYWHRWHRHWRWLRGRGNHRRSGHRRWHWSRRRRNGYGRNRRWRVAGHGSSKRTDSLSAQPCAAEGSKLDGGI